MTLAVAGLSIAAIFLSSSAGLLSRFYDQEREFQLAAESALEFVRSQLSHDSTVVIPDTGMVQLLAGYQVEDASGTALTRSSVNVYAAVTGDTGGTALPHVTLIAASYDANGTRHVRRVDLRRESFAHYSLFADQFNASRTFGPATVPGRVHTNATWRSGAGTLAAAYLDTVTAVVGLTGSGTYAATVTGVPRIPYPSDSTYPSLATKAAAANLSFTPVSASGTGWTSGSRLEFVTVDADADGTIDDDEGFVRIFDLDAGMDTTRLNVGLDTGTAKRWDDPVVQNQCGAFYLRDSRWHFFPVATHRADWAEDVIKEAGGSNYPSVTNPAMNAMQTNTYSAASTILSRTTARCFPAGSPFLMTTERFTNATGAVTGTASDTYPFGTSPSFSWPGGVPYGGGDTTFTARSRTCTFDASGECATSVVTLGTWRAFGGTPISGVSTAVRQAEELPRLWPFDPARNGTSRRVIHATSGPLYVSGVVRGRVLLNVSGDVRVIETLEYATDPAGDGEVCDDQLGVLAVGDILVADNALTRGRRVANTGGSQSIAKPFGGEHGLTLHGSFMSITGTVGVANAAGTGVVPLACPNDAAVNSSGGCLTIGGGMTMRTYTELHSTGSTGLRYAGVKDRCQDAARPPFFPLTNRYTFVRALEVSPVLANTPVKIRAILMKLKGRALE